MSDTIPELKSAAEIAAELTGSPKDTSDDPRDAKEYTFEFSHKDPRGRLYQGRFTNRILTVKQRRQVKVLKAQLSGNVPVGALDADAWEMNEMVAHLMISLDRSAVPDWAQDLEALYDEAIIYKLYAEVASHEARFHRREEAPSAGAEADSD